MKSFGQYNEATPPGMEKWVMKRKPEFKKRYGDKWQEVLYATAWNFYKKHGAPEEAEEEKWIQKAIKKPGQLHRDLGVPEDEDIPADMLRKAAQRDDKVGKRARLAITLKGMKKK